MKTLLCALLLSGFAFMMSCNEPPKKEEPGVKIEGKKGGEVDVNKKGTEIQGKKGGELKMDSNGVEIKKPNK